MSAALRGDAATTRIPVRWRDCDALGHVHHSVFLVYLEEGRDAFLRHALGIADPMYVVVRLAVDLKGGIDRLTSAVHVDTSVARVGRSSIALRERILTEQRKELAESETTIVWWDSAAGTPRELTTHERALLMGA